MDHHLTRHEQSVLRQLWDQLSTEDPDLAAQLSVPRARRPNRWAPTRWPSSVFLVAGLLFLFAGLALDVGSAVMAGLVLEAVVVCRSHVVVRAVAGTAGAGVRRWFA